MTYLHTIARIDRVSADFLSKYGDGRSEALDDLRQLLMAERERGIRDAIVDVCAWLRMPDPSFNASRAAAVQIACDTANAIADLYLRGSQIARLMRDESVAP